VGTSNIVFNRLVSSVPVLLSVQSDLGVTLNGSTVSAWADQTANGNNFSQGTAANQPTYAANSLNGFPIITFDGVNDTMVAPGPNLPAPATTNSFFWFVFKQVAWTNQNAFFQTNTNSSFALLQNSTTPNMATYEGTALGPNNGAATIGSWFRGECGFTGSTSDFLKIGATNATGTNTGNTDPTAGFTIGSNWTPGAWTNVSYVAMMICGGIPSANERSALSAAVTAKYGSSVGV